MSVKADLSVFEAEKALRLMRGELVGYVYKKKSNVFAFTERVVRQNPASASGDDAQAEELRKMLETVTRNCRELEAQNLEFRMRLSANEKERKAIIRKLRRIKRSISLFADDSISLIRYLMGS